ncbi:hypothetical protein [Streptomyces sp. ME19-01-6]|uniref:hypothetical protein n=1 Tax=Streptomyces sp. ME19-01-6 TaxID=3028686 RepID=UPI0029B7D313|nr:hypothetical protein [Streptomyces sp. ME19-01-6]MDX3233488.1 hypothetical protein [Streptomyces sp. ME19-01-6]
MDRSAAAPSSSLARAEQFVWLTARVLEQRRFAYHFLGGGADPVETALAAYLGDDGGYGHALEPDLRGPHSRPQHAAHALRVLDGIGRCGGRRVELLCRYLTEITTPDGALPAHRPAPPGTAVASWNPAADGSAGNLLATGPVVGLLHRNDVWHAWLFRATDFCWAAVAALEEGAAPRPHEVLAAVAFLDGAPDRPRALAAAERLGRRVRKQGLVVLDPDPERTEDHPLPEGRAPGERIHVYEVARTPDSPARPWFTDAEVERSLDFLADSQCEDGGWPLRRHPRASGAALEWRPIVTIEALLTLRAYGRAFG